MIKLADEFFEAKNDPMQISVNGETMEVLKRIHPNTMGEVANSDGPIAWVLVIPTTHELMKEFISKKINEDQLLHNTPLGLRTMQCTFVQLLSFRRREAKDWRHVSSSIN